MSVRSVAPKLVLCCRFLQEYIAGEGGEETKHELARHFELCDSDGDGYLSFSQFLRWVELCDLNPEDHLQVRIHPTVMPCRLLCLLSAPGVGRSCHFCGTAMVMTIMMMMMLW